MSNKMKTTRTALLTLLVALISLSVSAQNVTVKGTVKDKTGETVIGASVVEKGNTSNGTITDIDGTKISSLLLVNSLPNGKIQTINSMKYHSCTIKSKLNIQFKYHYLRHTYGTRLAELNTPTHILTNQMGHASGKVTERYYLAVSETGIEMLQKKLNEIDTDYKSDK